MALNSSGPISLGGTTAGQSIALENGGTGTSTISLNDAAVRSLAGVPSGAIIMPTNFYGKSNASYFMFYASSVDTQVSAGVISDSSNFVYGGYRRGSGTQITQVYKINSTGSLNSASQGTTAVQTLMSRPVITTTGYVAGGPQDGGGCVTVATSGLSLGANFTTGLATGPYVQFKPNGAAPGASGSFYLIGNAFYDVCCSSNTLQGVVKYSSATSPTSAANTFRTGGYSNYFAGAYDPLTDTVVALGQGYEGGVYYGVTKFNSSLAVQWTYQIQTFNFTGYAMGIAVGPSSEIAIVSCSSNSTSLAKLGSGGNVVWSRSITGNIRGKNCCFDSAGNIYFVGQGTNDPGQTLFILKYNSSGTLQWQRSWFSSGRNIYAMTIQVMANGAVLVGGAVGNFSPIPAWIVAVPPDGSKTGTYTAGITATYSVSTATDAAGSAAQAAKSTSSWGAFVTNNTNLGGSMSSFTPTVNYVVL